MGKIPYTFIKTITMVVAQAREIFEIETGTPAGDRILSSLAPVISFTLKATPHSLSLVDVFEGCHDGGLIVLRPIVEFKGGEFK
jgi:hypothetical protein